MPQLYNKVLLRLTGPATVAGRFAIQQAIKGLAGVVESEVTTEEATVTYDPEIAGLTNLKLALREAGYEVRSFEFVEEENLAPRG